MTGRKLYCSELVSIGAPLGGRSDLHVLKALLQRRLPPPAFLSFLLLLILSFLFCFAFSHALFLASFMRPGDLKITVSRRFENWVVFTRVRRGVESTAGLAIQTWMKTHKLTDLLFPRPQPNFFIPVSFIVLRTWLSASFDVGSTNVSVPVKGGEKVTKGREIDRKIHAFFALGGSKAVL